MGTTGLDVERLTGLLQRIKVDCSIVERDESADHCVLRLSSVKRSGRVAFVEYVNQGIEPRLVGIKFDPPNIEAEGGQSFWVSEQWMNLRGERSDDPKKVIDSIKQTFLKE